MRNRRRILLATGTAAGFTVLSLVGTLAWRRATPDPREEALSFLAAYRPLSTDPLRLGVESERVTLERQAYLREEDARMVEALPKAHGWHFSRTTGNFPYDVTASVSALSRIQNLGLRFPFLIRFISMEPTRITIRLIGSKRTSGDAESRRVFAASVGWTHTDAVFIGQRMGIVAPPEALEIPEFTPTPSGPGRKPGT